MPVSKDDLIKYVKELGLPEDQEKNLLDVLSANEKAATQFVGQRLRHDDYTRKTQELAAQRKTLEEQTGQQVAQYAQQLAEAQDKINKIMADLEQAKISEATANARLMRVKETYLLSDEDIPALDVRNPAGTKTDGGQIDLDKKLEEFGRKILSTLREDLSALPRVAALQSDIMLQHQELTGKRLTRDEMNELLSVAEKERVPLETAWERRYDIPKLRMEREIERRVKEELERAEAERRRKASEEALSGVRRSPEEILGKPLSPVLGRTFGADAKPKDPADSGPADKSARPRLSGAERAAAKFLERRSQGIPLGAPDTSAASA